MLTTRIILLMLLALICCQTAQSQNGRSISIRKANAAIEIDGQLDEADWQLAEMSTDFTQNFPTDTARSAYPTMVRMTYDDRMLYVSAICMTQSEKVLVESLRRDFTGGSNDNFAVFFNPMNDLRTGFTFSVNPYGSQSEGLLSSGGGFGSDAAWDNKWFAKTTRTDSSWTVEMGIPFKTLRYDHTLDQWHVNFMRQHVATYETSCWNAVPRGFNPSTLAYTGVMQWDNPPAKAGANFSIIPYATGGAQVGYTYTPDNDIKHLTNFGLDAKIAVSSSLNLDLTVNPDFSQAEVDQQVINLDRFNIFFPERRQFFLENADLFSRFGFSKIRPFFSRRIGLDNGRRIPILAGARLSGNLNEDWRIGLLTIQTEGKPATAEDEASVSENFTVAAFERKVFGVSNIAGILVNKQGFDGARAIKGDYNTLIGLDYNIADKRERLRGKVFYHHTLSPGLPRDAGANASWLRYRTRKVFLEWNHEYVGDNYNAEVGFVPRTAYFRLEPIARYFWLFDDHPTINSIQFGLYNSNYWNSDWLLTDMVFKPNVKFNFLNQSSVDFFYRELITQLVPEEVFDPTGVNDDLAPGKYNYRTFGVSYESDFRKPFSYFAFAQGGSFYIGNILQWSTGVTYRFRPWGSFSLNLDRNEIWYPAPNRDAHLTLIGAKMDVSFSKSVFFNTFVQYNTGADNINFNTRFQWRFRPMSDLFLVYTENYTDNFAVKNRAFVLKFVYWITL